MTGGSGLKYVTVLRPDVPLAVCRSSVKVTLVVTGLFDTHIAN